MALITDYSSLDSAVDGYLARADLSPWVPNFIQNAEQTLYRSLRIRAMENVLSGTIANGVMAVPTNPVYVELKYAYVNSAPITVLERMPADQLYALYPRRSGSAEIPTSIAVERTNFIFGPYPGNLDILGVYYGRLPALSVSNTTNWFTSYAPDLLLYGALLEAESFLMNDPRIPMWQQYYNRAFKSVQGEEVRQRHSGGALAQTLG